MANIKINLNKKVKAMKPMHGGGQPPIGGKDMTEFFHYVTEAGIPYSRLHDVGGAFASNRFVDIPNIFRNFDADENDPKNYDFVYTDFLIKSLYDAGVKPYFRLGITIENQSYIKTYHTDPPKDYDKWARICEHIVAHYIDGWADGFHYDIEYWEIWNEPDNAMKGRPSEMWSGTPEDYYRLYSVAAKHLKARFDNRIKVGGYASCGFYYVTATPEKIAIHPDYKYYIDFFDGFMRYLKATDTPIDFFSWHSYANTKTTLIWDEWLHTELEKYGFAGLETHLNEWDPYAKEFGTAHHSAEVAAMMIGMQHGHTDLCCIYDMRTNTAPYCPLFDIKTHKPIHGYYSMVAFNALYRLGMQVEAVCDTDGLYVLAASNGKKNAMMISNLTGERQDLSIEGVDLSDAYFHVIDQERLLSWSPAVSAINPNEVILIEW